MSEVNWAPAMKQRRSVECGTCGGDHEDCAGGGLEDLLHVLEEDLGHGRDGRRAVVLVLPAHGADYLVRDVHRARDEQVGPARGVHVVRHVAAAVRRHGFKHRAVR
jgi:hypothetical protein